MFEFLYENCDDKRIEMIRKKLGFLLIFVNFSLFLKGNGLTDECIQVPGLLDIRTDFSDGIHSLESIVKLAKRRGFHVLFINDHDRVTLEYGIRPFQNLLKKKLRHYPAFFLLKNKTKSDVLEVLRNGRMYACRGDADSAKMILENFSVYNSETSQKAVMGEEIVSKGFPRLNVRISYSSPEKGNFISERLIRSGKLVETFAAKAPWNVSIQDDFFEPGKKICYRLDAKDNKGREIVSNPIFVRFLDEKDAKE